MHQSIHSLPDVRVDDVPSLYMRSNASFSHTLIVPAQMPVGEAEPDHTCLTTMSSELKVIANRSEHKLMCSQAEQDKSQDPNHAQMQAKTSRRGQLTDNT